MKAVLRSYRQAPRKVRLVANLIKGKTVSRALVELDVLPKRASAPMKKLLLSAVANAKENNKIELADLFVKEVRVDGGMILKRSMPKSHGSAHPIHKHTSHVMIELIANADTAKTAPAKAKEEKVVTEEKSVKKAAPKAKAPAKAKATKTVKKTK